MKDIPATGRGWGDGGGGSCKAACAPVGQSLTQPIFVFAQLSPQASLLLPGQSPQTHLLLPMVRSKARRRTCCSQWYAALPRIPSGRALAMLSGWEGSLAPLCHDRILRTPLSDSVEKKFSEESQFKMTPSERNPTAMCLLGRFPSIKLSSHPLLREEQIEHVAAAVKGRVLCRFSVRACG